MIQCLICKNLKRESFFTEMEFDGLAICYSCKGKPEKQQQLKELYNSLLDEVLL